MTNGTGQDGWDGPIELDWGYQLDSLRDLLATFAPADSMALRQDLRRPTTTTLNHDKTEITIKIDPPSLSYRYARIQDEGGIIPPYDIIKAKGAGHVMRAEIPSGSGNIRFFTRRKGFTLPGFQYVDRAVAAWFAIRSSVVIKWREGRAGQGLRTQRGATISSP